MTLLKQIFPVVLCHGIVMAALQKNRLTLVVCLGVTLNTLMGVCVPTEALAELSMTVTHT